MIWLIPFYQSLVSRLHGGGFFSAPKQFKAFLWAAPLAWIIANTYQAEYHSILISIFAALFTLATCMAGKNTGHGNFMDLGRTNAKPERLEFIVSWIKNPFWKDFAGLSVTGLAAVSGAVFCLGGLSPLGSLVLCLGGLSKAVAYWIGWKIRPDYHGKWFVSTEIGEYLTGFFVGVALAICYYMA